MFRRNILSSIPSLQIESNFIRFDLSWPSNAYASLHLAIIGSENGLSPVRRQTIVWTSAGLSLTWPSGTNFNKIQIEIRNKICEVAPK